MLTIIADKLSAAGWSWAIAVPAMVGVVISNNRSATFSVGVHEEIRSFLSHDGGDAIFWATGLYSLYMI